MKEEIYSMFREYLTPEKGYRLLTLKERENKTIIGVTVKDNRKVYKSLKGTVYDASPEAVKRLEQIGSKAIDKIRDSVEMDANGESLFDSMVVIDDVDVLLKAITASSKYSFEDLVDYSDNNIYFTYVVDYIGVKNKEYNKKLANWYWSDDYYKVMIERSPYKPLKVYNTDFVKFYGASREKYTSNSYEVYGIVNSDLEVAVLAGTKVSNSFELAANTGMTLFGLSCDWRSTTDNNNVLQYSSYLSDAANAQLRKVCFTTSAVNRMKLVRNKKISLKDIFNATNKMKQYNEDKNVYKSVDEYKKDRNILTQFNQIISDSRFGVKYTIVDSLAFIRQYDEGFELIEISDDGFGIKAKLLVNFEYSCGYILEGTEFNRIKAPLKASMGNNRFLYNAYKVFHDEFSDDSGYCIKDSGLLSFTEISTILYGYDIDSLGEHNIFDKEIVRIRAVKKKEVKLKKEAKPDVLSNEKVEQLKRELEEKREELEKLKYKVSSLEKYLEDYTSKIGTTIVDLEQNLKNAAILNSSLMASMMNFRNDMRVVLGDIKDMKFMKETE